MSRIVVVEDNLYNMKLTVFLLKSAGHEVLQAFDAEAGLALIMAHRPDLILMDVHLPGMDGLSATRLIKGDADLAHIPVIALTAHAMDGDGEAMRADGCDGYISKPFRREIFLNLIGKMLDESLN